MVIYLLSMLSIMALPGLKFTVVTAEQGVIYGGDFFDQEYSLIKTSTIFAPTNNCDRELIIGCMQYECIETIIIMIIAK